MKQIDILGERYGRLTVLARVAPRKGKVTYSCRCDCGATVVTLSSYLRRGDTRSCGCLKREETVLRFTTHGHAGANKNTPTHNSWRAMHERCRLPSHPAFKNYGGRGIKVCSRWALFENFLLDMGERPNKLTLDRVDVNGDYEPSNCRWATHAEQVANRRPRALRCAKEN